MLPLIDMRNSDFSWGRMLRKSLKTTKKELRANPLVQSYNLQEVIGGVPSQEGHPVIYVTEKLTPAEHN